MPYGMSLMRRLDFPGRPIKGYKNTQLKQILTEIL